MRFSPIPAEGLLAEGDIGTCYVPKFEKQAAGEGQPVCKKTCGDIVGAGCVSTGHHTTPYDKILEPDIRASTQCAMEIVMFLRPLQMHFIIMRKNQIKSRRPTLLRIH